MRRWSVLLIALVLLVLAACGQGENSGQADEASDEKVIKVGASPDGYPQYFMEDDEMKGFSVDVIKAITQEVGYEVEWVLTDWNGILANMETSKVDTIANFAVSPEREDKYNFTNPYYHSKTVIAVSENNETIHSLDDLKGKRVANVLGSNYANVLKEKDPNDEIEIVNFESQDVINSDVATGKMDAFVSGREILLAQINDKQIPLKIAGEPFGDKPVALPFVESEENNELISKMNTAIAKLKEDGTISELSKKWYGIDLLEN